MLYNLIAWPCKYFCIYGSLLYFHEYIYAALGAEVKNWLK